MARSRFTPHGYSYREPLSPRYRRPRVDGVGFFLGCLGLVVIIGIISAICVSAYFATHRSTEVCTVTEKSMGFDKDGKGKYRVFSDCGVFEVQDSLFNGKFNSADTYASIHRGRTYEFITTGYRNGFFSTFPNIIEAHER